MPLDVMRMKREHDEKSQRRIKRQRRNLFIYHAFAFILGAGISGLGLYLNMENSGSGMIFIDTLTVCGIAIILTSIFGLAASHHLRALLGYLVLLLLQSMVLIVFGGVCLILNTNLTNFLKDKDGFELASTVGSNDILSGLVSSDKEGGMSEHDLVKTILNVIGGSSLVLAFLLLRIMRLVGKLVGTNRALVMLLQTMNLVLIPIGMACMAGGFFIADSAAGSTDTTDIGAVFFVCIGVVISTVSFLGCLAAATSSDRILVLYSILIALVMSILLCAGIASFVLSAEVKSFVLENWNAVRLSLPPTFAGRYDKDIFEQWFGTNLNAMGYTCLCLGLYCTSMLITSFSLRNRFLEDEDNTKMRRSQSMRRMIEALGGGQQITFDDADGSNNTEVMNKRKSVQEILKRAWTQRWIKASKAERRMVQASGICCCLICLVPIILGMTLLMYDSFCVNISEHYDPLSRAILQNNLRSYKTLEIVNNYEMGNMRLEFPGDTMAMNPKTKRLERMDLTVLGNITAAKKVYASDQKLSVIPDKKTGALVFGLEPKEGKFILERDISCQNANLDLRFSNDSLSFLRYQDLKIRASSNIEIFTTPGNEEILSEGYFNSISLASNHGIVIISGIHVGVGGASVQNPTGSILLDSVFLLGSDSGSVSMLLLSSDVGLIEAKNLTLKDSNFRVVSPSGPVTIKNIRFLNTPGGKRGGVMDIYGKRAGINIQDVTLKELRLSSLTGGIYAKNIETSKFSAVSTEGNLQIHNLGIINDGFVEIESVGGSIYIKVNLDLGFFGIFDLNTGSKGSITVKGDESIFSIDEGASKNSVSGIIYGENEPAYGGEIIITSEYGDITLVIGNMPEN